jgi:hypothetical protein
MKPWRTRAWDRLPVMRMHGHPRMAVPLSRPFDPAWRGRDVDGVEPGLSIAAIAIAIVTFALSFWHQRVTAALSRKPVLVFVYTEDGWVLGTSARPGSERGRGEEGARR